jgi:hypothetical protein
VPNSCVFEFPRSSRIESPRISIALAFVNKPVPGFRRPAEVVSADQAHSLPVAL